MLFSQPLLNGCQDFFCCFDISIFIYLFEYKIIETKAPEFLAVNISVLGGALANVESMGFGDRDKPYFKDILMVKMCLFISASVHKTSVFTLNLTTYRQSFDWFKIS